MITVRHIQQHERGLLPAELREKPAFIAFCDGEYCGYCSYDITDDTLTFTRLCAPDDPLARELLVRAPAASLAGYFEYCSFPENAGFEVFLSAHGYSAGRIPLARLLAGDCGSH